MNANSLYNGITGISDAYIMEALEMRLRKKQPGWKRWTAAAACACLVLVGIVLFSSYEETGKNAVQTWYEDFPVESYFPSATPEGIAADHILPESEIFVQTRDFSGQRAQLEQEGIIPTMATHEIFECQAYYDAEESLGYVTISWHNRDSIETYSDLTVLVSRQPVETANDCVDVALDKNGTPIEPTITVTQRDGVPILGERSPDGTKTLSFQLDSCWYQITGSWNDDYASVVALLDWVWEHPIALERFSME